MYELPLFPLHTVLFPGMPLRLHIFEERYRTMMAHVLNTSRSFGVNLIKTGMEAYGPLPLPYPTGCTARIVKVHQNPDGSLDLTAIGDERFRILHMSHGQPYLTAFVESSPLHAHHTMEVVRRMHSMRRLVGTYLKMLSTLMDAKEHSSSLDLDLDLTGLQLPDDPMMLIYLSAALLQVPAREKQPLLEAETAGLLLGHLQRLYRREIAVLPPLLDMSEEHANHCALLN